MVDELAYAECSEQCLAHRSSVLVIIIMASRPGYPFLWGGRWGASFYNQCQELCFSLFIQQALFTNLVCGKHNRRCDL